jgi:sRNA-binding carbon storage regulator CsrA
LFISWKRLLSILLVRATTITSQIEGAVRHHGGMPMLVLSRRIVPEVPCRPRTRENEIVLFCPGGERIVFSLLETTERRGIVRVGIDAPRSVTILRGELEGAQHEFAVPAGSTN